jgi:S-adenosylmethionine synthetase
MGQQPRKVLKHFKNHYYGDKDMEVELFTWEKLDSVDLIRKAFGIK